MVDEGSAEGGSRGVRYERLLAEAVPEIYRINAFRVTQLPVNATQREVSRQVEKISMAAKIGVAAELNDKVMPLVPPPDSDALRHAVQRLRDPEKRFLDELFWFWPSDDGAEKDVALQTLRTEGPSAAAAVWEAAEGQGGRRGTLAQHNLAVLWHIAALDAEHEERVGNLSDAGRKALPALWDAAFKRWGELRKSVPFWQVLRERVKEINDPRLDDSTVANARKTLPEALAVISARLAMADFDAGKTDACRRVLSRLWESGLPQADIKRAIRDALGPVRARFKASGEAFENRPEGKPRGILVAAGRFLEQTERLLLLVDMALPNGDAMRVGLHDDVALTVMGMTIAYANESEDFRGSIAWLERASTIAEGEAARHRAKENIATARENADAKVAYDRAAVRAAASPRYRQGSGGGVAAAGASAVVGGASCLVRTFGIFIVIALIGGVISLAGKGCGCDSTSSSSSNSGSSYSLSGYDSGSASDSSVPDTPDAAPSVNYNAIANKISAMIKYNNSLPRSVTNAKPSVATKFLMYAGGIETWAALNDPDNETSGLCKKASNLARAAAALYKDPSSDSAWSRWNTNVKTFNRAWRNWGKSH